MARPRGFDEAEVLRKALGVFRARGFDGATLDELERATGLGRGSLYGAFGDKRALFRRALACYRETALDERLAALGAPGAGRAALLGFFRALADDASCDRERKGCLVTNCSVELADRDPDLSREVARNLDRFERAFAGAVTRAQAAGEIDPTRDAGQLARFLTVCMEGMLVLARIRPDAAWLDDAVAVIDGVLR
jgi:TetR/AcrR family transcriptional repressor of nem operon